MIRAVFCLGLFFATCSWCVTQPDADTIIRRSADANKADWKAAPGYDHFERDRGWDGTKTYDVTMIDGSPYRELVAVNGQPLGPQQRRWEQQKLEQVIAQRSRESAAQRAARIQEYERGQKREHLLMQEMTRAFHFTLLGERSGGPYTVYLLQATPRPGYQPPELEARALTGMRGRLWIDKQTYQWVRVEAEVVRPVSIEGFLARVEPGTHFGLEKMPVAPGVWLPKRFVMRSNARIFLLFHRRMQADETYFNYKPASIAAGAVNKPHIPGN